MGHGLGSFIAVLMAVAIIVAAYKVLTRKSTSTPSSGGPGGLGRPDGHIDEK